MVFTHAQREFLVREQMIGSALFNLVLNAGLCWLTFRGHSTVSVWGDPGVVVDMMATAFILPLLVALITAPLVMKAARAGKVEPLALSLHSHPQLRLMPTSAWLMALTVALLASLAMAAPILGGFRLLAVKALPLPTFVVLKALYCAALAGVVAPVAAIHTLLRAASGPALR